MLLMRPSLLFPGQDWRLPHICQGSHHKLSTHIQHCKLSTNTNTHMNTYNTCSKFSPTPIHQHLYNTIFWTMYILFARKINHSEWPKNEGSQFKQQHLIHSAQANDMNKGVNFRRNLIIFLFTLQLTFQPNFYHRKSVNFGTLWYKVKLTHKGIK